MTKRTIASPLRPMPSACLLFAAVALAAGTAHASGSLDVLASAQLGDDLGGRPLAVSMFDDGGLALLGVELGGVTLVRLDATGTATTPVQHLSQTYDDLAVDRRTGQVALVGPTGLTVLAADLESSWSVSLPGPRPGDPPRHIDVGEHGTIAVAAAGEIHVFSPDGERHGRVDHSEATTTGIAVLDAADVVVTTGWTVGSCGDATMATLTAFGRDGTPRWEADAVPLRCGRTDRTSARGVDVTRGDDGLVYLLAEVDGAGEALRDDDATVAFDATTTAPGLPSVFAYYARFTPTGDRRLAQAFAIPEDDAAVHPRAIAADEDGNVHLLGTSTHALEPDDDVGHLELLAAPSAFYQVVRADFRRRLFWQPIEIDDADTEAAAIALAGDRVVTVLHAQRHDDADPSVLPMAPLALVWPTDPDEAVEKRPDRDDVGTFGYESGIAGSDPTCYACATGNRPRPLLALVVALLGLAVRSRRRRVDRD